MSDLLSLFDMTERAEMATLIRPPAPDAPLPGGWPEGGIAPHPFASINRMMNKDEARELRADIDAHGLLELIVIYEDKILDGRNRYLECVALGRFPANVDWRTHKDFVEFDGPRWDKDKGTDALAFVWGMEVRRHRSAKDTALAAARYLRFIRDLYPQPLADRSETGSFGQPAGAPLTAKLRLPTQAEIAKRHGISERLVHSAMMLLERAEPEVVQAVEQGTMALTDAADVVSKLDRLEQRIIAENPDRKSTKAAVKAAKKPAVAPDLPAPMSRSDLANFAEMVINEARRVAKAHGGRGASMNADLVLNHARALMIIEPGDEYAYTRSMLLALGKLREMPSSSPRSGRSSPRGSARPTASGPMAPPLGGEWSLKIGGLKADHTASLAVFHEDDDTYSISTGYDFGARGRAEPFGGAYPSFAVAVATAAGHLRAALDEIAGDDTETISEKLKASAHAGVTWLDKKLIEWGIPFAVVTSFTITPDEDENTQREGSGTAREAPGGSAPSDGIAGLEQGAQPAPRHGLEEAYTAALAVGREHHGKHTIRTAEPILRAGVAADIKRQKMADDMNAPIGSIKGWCGKLGLQDHARLTDNADRINERRRTAGQEVQ
ncbi:MAG: hypothetical protein HY834_09035 [Devosia nanyangense]|uniref:ParB/Sulfiredoxin domain-containing protein n=1 Tax=Devosia nanyangense TaxID=1228055 RepID=A0A933L3Y3_9HYPH|nr:hypothetical protein [Devosia nanyangense]